MSFSSLCFATRSGSRINFWPVDNTVSSKVTSIELSLRRELTRDAFGCALFEDVDLPGFKTVDGIAEVVGNYPSAGGVGERAAWFRDSEGNLLGIGQPVR